MKTDQIKTGKMLIVTGTYIGDTIISIPFMRELRLSNPSSFIGAVATNQNYDLLKHGPYLDKLYIIDYKTLSRKNINIIKDMRKENFDCAFLLKQNIFTELVAYYAGVKNRIARNKNYKHTLATHFPESEPECHMSECFLGLMGLISQQASSAKPELHLDEISVAYAKNYVAKVKDGKSACIGIGITGSKRSKKWPIKNFYMLSEYLAKQRGASIVVIAGPKEKNETEFTECNARINGFDVQVVSESIDKTLAIIGELDMLITNDSFPHHAAAALDIPSLILFRNETTARNWKAPKKNHIGLVAEGNNLENLPLESVLAAYEKMNDIDGRIAVGR